MADWIVQQRRAQMFPTLSASQIARLAAHAQKRTVHAGEVVFEQGDENAGVFVVLSGSLAIVRPGIGVEDHRSPCTPPESSRAKRASSPGAAPSSAREP